MTDNNWTTASPTPDQMVEMLEQIKSGKITEARMRMFLDGAYEPSDYELAESILGEDFISPEQVAECWGLEYDKPALDQLCKTFPDQRILRWFKEHYYLLLPGPPWPMSIIDIREMHLERYLPRFFGKKLGRISRFYWIYSKKETFSRKEQIGPRWLGVRKQELPGGRGELAEAQFALLDPEERLGLAVEYYWALICYLRINGRYLFWHLGIRTETMTSSGNSVVVGWLNEKEPTLNDYSPEGSVPGVAIGGVRR